MDHLEVDKFMRDYKLVFNKSIFIILVSFTCIHNGICSQVYSYDKKLNIDISDLKQDEHIEFLLIDEFCSVCETLIKSEIIKNKNPNLATLSTPSFKWLAKLKRHNPKYSVYNIKGLLKKLEKKTPQFIVLNEQGKIVEALYGKTKIITLFNQSIRKQ